MAEEVSQKFEYYVDQGTYKENRRSHLVQNHICGHLRQNVADKEDADDCIILFVD